MGAAASGALVLVGDKLGLYKALAGAGPTMPEALAKKTSTTERYIREWLEAQAAAWYVNYHSESGAYSMSDEQAAALADESSPVFSAGAFEVIGSMFKDEPKITEAFKSGRGVGWHEHSQCLFRGTERFFRTSYATHLVNDWLPALEGVVGLFVSGAAPILVFAIVVLIRIRELSTFGVRRVSPRWLLIAALLAAACFAVILTFDTVIQHLFPGIDDSQDIIRASSSGGALTLVASILFGAILTPLGEELRFRGVLTRFFERWGSWVAIIVSALIFAFSASSPSPSVILPFRSRIVTSPTTRSSICMRNSFYGKMRPQSRGSEGFPQGPERRRMHEDIRRHRDNVNQIGHRS
jgi:membrane protease YdiL (CAAX protease family)